VHLAPLATDWATISSIVTGAATLVLAVATFAAVRSSNRSARIAEAALQEQRRPVLAQSRFGDPVQKIMFVEGHWIHADGGQASVEHIDGRVYLGANLRNVGSGIAVCQAWTAQADLITTAQMPDHAPLEQFRLQTRDLYIPNGDVGIWQGAMRDPDDTRRAALARAIDARKTISLELLYTDQIGQQRTITRFGIVPAADRWFVTVTRHWYLDWDGPRPQRLITQAVETVMREAEAADHAGEHPAEHEPAAGDGEHPAEHEPAAGDGELTADDKDGRRGEMAPAARGTAGRSGQS
jgi:hypothetical protein